MDDSLFIDRSGSWGGLPSQPRHTMQRKLVLWTVGLVVVSTFVCTWWLTRVAREAMTDNHARGVAVLNQTIAAALSGRLAYGWNPSVNGVLGVLELDSRVALVAIEDANGGLLHRRLVDPAAWSIYVDRVGHEREFGPIEMGRAEVLGELGDLIVHKAPIWNPPLRAGLPDGGGVGRDRSLEGFVTLVVREPSLPQTLTRLRTTQLLTSCVVSLLSLPVVVWVMRHWTAPIRSLLDATQRLARGDEPRPVSVRTRDEMGLLSRSFNQMAGKLSAARLELEQANEQLEHKVHDRTAQLECANRQLELEIRDKDEFLRAVTHDLSAPLRNIGGMAAMLLTKYKDGLADDALKKLERIGANVKVQTELLNDLCEIGRIRTRPGKRRAVDLQEVVDQLRDNLGYDLEHAGITLEVDGTLPTIMADRNRLRQVFQNLIDNAVKYMDRASGGRVTIAYRPDGPWHEFRVIDNGQGIAPEDLTVIFQVFRRSTRGVAPRVAGRGVGLATVKSIVESYGGRVWATSEEGAGSTFHFTLDRRVVDTAVTQADPAGRAVS
jgi:signal transduction histidine kinase